MSMTASEAMMVLTRAGEAQGATNHVERVTNEVQGAYREINADESRTDAWKKEQCQAVYDSAMERLTDELNRRAAKARTRELEDTGSAFGVAGLPGDAASLTISLRDAQDRVAQAKSADELRGMLERANRSSDEVLARAVAEKAFNDGDGDTLNLFLETRPALEDKLQRLWDGRRRVERGSSMPFALTLAAIRPPR